MYVGIEDVNTNVTDNVTNNVTNNVNRNVSAHQRIWAARRGREATQVAITIDRRILIERPHMRGGRHAAVNTGLGAVAVEISGQVNAGRRTAGDSGDGTWAARRPGVCRRGQRRWESG